MRSSNQTQSMKNSKIKARGAILSVVLFVSMLVIQSCATSQYGCPGEISKAETKQETRS
jgi:hypothetical protein